MLRGGGLVIIFVVVVRSCRQRCRDRAPVFTRTLRRLPSLRLPVLFNLQLIALLLRELAPAGEEKEPKQKAHREENRDRKRIVLPEERRHGHDRRRDSENGDPSRKHGDDCRVQGSTTGEIHA